MNILGEEVWRNPICGSGHGEKPEVAPNRYRCGSCSCSEHIMSAIRCYECEEELNNIHEYLSYCDNKKCSLYHLSPNGINLDKLIKLRDE